MNIIDIITLKHPGIQHISYWESHYDGTPWNDPYEGLIWENADIPKPTKKELAQWAIDVDLQYRQQQAVAKRVYPPITDQMDMMYKDNINGTSAWKDTIAAIKAAHPKPVE